MTTGTIARTRVGGLEFGHFIFEGTPAELEPYRAAYLRLWERQGRATANKMGYHREPNGTGGERLAFRVPLNQMADWMRDEITPIRDNLASQ
ncbi:hypothetical protein LB518_10095 [Mesorhizobium sp. BR1-1-16]|nr:hypothetical protein [Mesorhizobium sp. BR1-1-16]